MGVDILIVVDAGFPLQPRKNLNSLPSITNQMLSILLRKDIERDLATLGPKTSSCSRSSAISPPMIFPTR